jgi:DNA polymerase III delta subunit
MIYVFSGSDTDKKIKAREEVLKISQDREVFFVNEGNFSPEQFQNFLAGDDLFAKKYFVILDSLISSDVSDLILDKAVEMKNSENIFVIIETEILKAPTEILKKVAKEWKTFDLPKASQAKFNIFSITDAFGARDKKNTWVLMQKAIYEGVAAEEILNILIWQTKNLLFVMGGEDMKSTGLSSFVYNKSKSYSKNYKPEELKDISRELVKMFHESHLGLELEPNLEKFLLKTL